MITALPARGLIGLVTLYRFTLGPLVVALFGAGCRYYPSCSAYTIEALKVHGAWKGTRLGASRIARCRPGAGHGHDPVPRPEVS